VIPNLERRYKETDFAGVREELAKYISNKDLPGLRGQPPARGSAHVKVGGETIYSVSGKSLKEGLGFFRQLKLDGSRAQIRRPHRQGNHQPGRFLNDVGLEYLSTGPLRRNPLRRRGAAHPPGLADRLGPDRRDVRAR